MASNRTAKRAIQVRSEAGYVEDGKLVTTSTTTRKILLTYRTTPHSAKH